MMFTEGLDRDALKWVREGHGGAVHSHGRIDALRAVRGAGAGGGLGMPPPEKFRSGHLPRPAHGPLSRADDGSAASGSDMEESSDTDEVEVCSGRYSVDSSPRRDDIPRRTAMPQYRYANVPGLQGYYSSDYSDLSSSRDTALPKAKQQQFRRPQAQVGRYVEEEEFSDSAGSSEFSSQVDTRTSRGGYASEYSHNGPARRDANSNAVPKTRMAAEENYSRAAPLNSRTYQHENYSANVPAQDNVKSSQMDGLSDVPSAPPIHTYDQEIGPASHHVNVNECDDSTVKKEECNDDNVKSNLPDRSERSTLNPGHSSKPSSSVPIRVPTFHASLQNVLLQSEEELMAKRTSELVSDGVPSKPKKTIGKMKVQVRKVRMSVDIPSGCSFSSLPVVKLNTIRYRLSNVQSTLSSGWESVRRIQTLPQLPANSSFSKHSLAYMQASAQYIKQVSGVLKVGVTTLRNSSSYETPQETYSCQLRLKSSPEDDLVPMQPGSGETHVFFPDSLGDDLIIDVSDSKGKPCGRVVAQVATMSEESADKLRWWSIYREPEHELVGRIQLYIHYTTAADDNNAKYGSVAETVAYDIVLEVAMKAQHIQQRNLILHGPWKWLLTEFALYYGVSDAYTKLRYLSYIMDVATPTADWLNLVHELLLPVLMKTQGTAALSHQENRILGEVEEQIEQTLAMVFENYKSLDESLPSGLAEEFRPPTGLAACALEPAIKLYSLLHDAAARKRSRRYMLETDEYVAGNSEGIRVDLVTFTTAYQKMKSLCCNLRNEIFTDIEIHNQHILPSFVDLPNLAASIYSVELSNRLRAFLVACPPTGPSSPVADLVIATADFQKDLASWNICPIKAGVDAKELFHLYIVLWIEDKRRTLLENCRMDKVKWSGVRTQHMTTPFVDEMYDLLKNTLTEYEVIICRWPEYIFVLENAIADVEKAVIESLEKQYGDVLAPLKDCIAPKKFGLKYVQKLTKRNSVVPYTVPEDLGILLNTMKRLLDVLRPRIESHLKSWSSCIPNGGNTTAIGERLSEVTVTLRAKFRNYMQAVVEKLSENTRMQNTTKLKKIIQDSKELVMESDIRSRMQALKDQLVEVINHVHKVSEVHVFVAICRGFWDRMGQDVLSFLENRKENRAWYKGARVAVSVLDDTFASQMQQLLGNSIQQKELEPPRSIMEVRSILCKDAPRQKNSSFYY
uniref:MHD1 domain-containing protein n=1 Tax=Leersia perrieri TaxID=77586 RepID=A0A0D9VLB5_9ORYZ